MATTPTEKIAALRSDFSMLSERVEALLRDGRDIREDRKATLQAIQDLTDRRADARQENAVLRQPMLDHIARYQERDRKLWILIGVVAGAAISFVANLILAFVKK